MEQITLQNCQLPKRLYTWAICYFLAVVVINWRLHPDLGVLLFFLGSVIGLHLLVVMERVINFATSPFRNITTQIILILVTFFVLSSSNNLIGIGVVLFLNLYFLYVQFVQFHKTKSLASWFAGFAVELNDKNQTNYLRILWVALVFETLLFTL